MPTTSSATLTERHARLPIATSGQVPSVGPSRRTNCFSFMTTKVCATCCRIRSRFSSLHHSFRRQQSPILALPRHQVLAPKCRFTRKPSLYTTARMGFRVQLQSPPRLILRLDADSLPELRRDSAVRLVWTLRAL